MINQTIEPAFRIPLDDNDLRYLGELVVIQGQIDELVKWTFDMSGFPPRGTADRSGRNADDPQSIAKPDVPLGQLFESWITRLRARRAPTSAEGLLTEEIYADASLFLQMMRNPLLHGHYWELVDGKKTSTTPNSTTAMGEAYLHHGRSQADGVLGSAALDARNAAASLSKKLLSLFDIL